MSRIEINLDMMPCCCAECPLHGIAVSDCGIAAGLRYCVPLRKGCVAEGLVERLPDCPLRPIDDDGQEHSWWHKTGSSGYCDYCDEYFEDVTCYKFCPSCGAMMDGGPYEDLFPGPIYEDKKGGAE